MDKDANVILRNKKDSKRIRQCRVVFSYKQDHEDELNLNVGDIIDILGEEEEGWWKGILNGKIGVFPSNFCEEIDNDDTNNIESSDAKQVKILCEVKYPYKAQNEDELSLNEGDIVTLLSKDGQDPGWWKGQLNGVVGVFPDNFVVILPSVDKPITNDPLPIKPSSIALQRKSLETKTEKIDPDGNKEVKTPPATAKKPNVAVKKSPSGATITGALFSGIKKKIADAVDGATSSKVSGKNEETVASDNVFDQVERVSLLVDVRATRVKAPAGRRPPSVVFREDDASTGIPNGTATEPHPIDERHHQPAAFQSLPADTAAADAGGELKPKLREWEKYKAPWLAEMKLNQAKRSSTSPGPQERTRIGDAAAEGADEPKKERHSPPPPEMSRSLSSLPNVKTKPLAEFKDAPSDKPTEKAAARPKSVAPAAPAQRPLSVQGSPVSSTEPPPIVSQKPPVVKMSPNAIKSPVPLPASRPDSDIPITFKQYSDLLERVHKLELLVEKQSVLHAAAIDELKGKLQLETEMRHMLQVQLEKVTTQSLMQV